MTRTNFLVKLILCVLCYSCVALRIAGGDQHTLYVHPTKSVLAFGSNLYGQLGARVSSPPYDIPYALKVYSDGALNNKQVVDVAGGLAHSVFLTADGAVYTAGSGLQGQLGAPSYPNITYEPVPVYAGDFLSGKSIVKVAAGDYFTVALSSDGKVFTWGANEYGQLGLGDNQMKNEPIVVTGALLGKTIIDIAAGRYHTLAIASTGQVFSWGSDNYGQLGNGNWEYGRNTPGLILTNGFLGGSERARNVTAGMYHSLVLTESGRLYCFGYSYNGECGTGYQSTYNSPVQINSYYYGNLPVVKIASGFSHNLVLLSNGKVFAFGNNQYGQCGDGTTYYSKYYPTATLLFGNGTHVASEIACGGQHSIILSTHNHLYVWGSDVHGQLGNGYPFQSLASPFRMSLSFCFDRSANDPLACSAHGTCTSDDSCTCSQGYATVNCSQPICFNKFGSEACSARGVCIAPNQCSCWNTHYGSDCSLTKCFTVPSSSAETCSAHGQCVDYDLCKCSNGWTGLKCEFPVCFEKPSTDPDSCSGNGFCKGANSCLCRRGYFGNDCSIVSCFGHLSNDSLACSSHGSCIGPNYCDCSSSKKYTGVNCELPICFERSSSDPLACSSHGTCVAPNKCQCNTNYNGETCQFFNNNNNSSTALVTVLIFSIVSIVAIVGLLVVVILVAVYVKKIKGNKEAYITLNESGNSGGNSSNNNSSGAIKVTSVQIKKNSEDENPFGTRQEALQASSGYNEL